MKKQYMKPQLAVFALQVQGQLLDYSGAGLGAHELKDDFDFGFDDDDFKE